MQVITTREFLEKAAALKGNIVYPLNAEPILYRMERDYDVDRTPAVRALGKFFCHYYKKGMATQLSHSSLFLLSHMTPLLCRC